MQERKQIAYETSATFIFNSSIIITRLVLIPLSSSTDEGLADGS